MKKVSGIIITESVNEYEKRVKKVEEEEKVEILQKKNAEAYQKKLLIKSALKEHLSVISESLSMQSQ